MHYPEGNKEVGRSVLRALSKTGIAVLYHDRNLTVQWAENVPYAWTSEDLTGKSDSEFLPPNEARHLIEAKRAVLETGEPENFEIVLERDGILNWYEVWIDADRLESGHIVGLTTTAVDISEQKQREQTLKTLLREVSHRSKNLLAVIQSIATQTGRSALSVDAFLNKFRGRIQSLAASQDLVTSSNWRGAFLRELIQGQVGRYADDAERSLQVSGANPYLNPNASMHIGLALHELAVNSASYGALSSGGKVAICAEITTAASNSKEMILTWTEQVDVETGAKTEKRFGTAALERVVPTSINGNARLQIREGQLLYELHVPNESFEAD